VAIERTPSDSAASGKTRSIRLVQSAGPDYARARRSPLPGPWIEGASRIIRVDARAAIRLEGDPVTAAASPVITAARLSSFIPLLPQPPGPPPSGPTLAPG
jgi:hypothetical protein